MKKKRHKGEKAAAGLLQHERRTPDIETPWSLLVLTLLPLVYFSPYFLDPDRMIFGTDWIPTGGYARMCWERSYLLDTLTYPKWLPHLFSGYSTITAYGDTFFYPLNFLSSLLPTDLQRVLLFALHAAISGIGVFFFLRLLGCGLYPALFAGVVSEFSGVILTTTYAGHLGRMIAAALLPVSFALLVRALRRRRLGSFLLYGGVMGLHLLGGHFQMSYLALLSMALLVPAYLLVRVKSGWPERVVLLAYFGLAIVLASAVAAVKYLPPYFSLEQGARGVERGYEYATSWSLPVGETFDLLVPNFSGILDDYWGLNYFKLSNEYLGVMALLLAVVTAVVLRRDRWVRFFSLYSVLFLLFAYGGNTPFFRLPYEFVPLLSKLRGPAMAFFMVSFGLISLAGIGLNAIFSEDPRRSDMIRGVGIAGALVFLLALFLSVFGHAALGLIARSAGGAIETLYGQSERIRRIGLLELNFPEIQARLWVAFTIALSLYLGIYLFGKGKISRGQLVAGMILITVIDQWSVDRRYLEPAPAHDVYFAGDDVVAFLKQDPGVFRVFPLRYRHDVDGLLLLNGIETIGGYGANPPRRYQQFIGAGESVMFNPANLLRDRGLLDLLNVKYIIIPVLPEDLSRLSSVEKRMVMAYRGYLSGCERVFSGSHSIYRVPEVLPRAYVVFDYRVVSGEGEALEGVLSPDFDHRRSVILEKDPGLSPPPQGSDPIKEIAIVDRDLHRMVCVADLPKPGILVVSENDHPDWRASVDGRETEILHANYVLKGVPLTQGRHTVEFRYRSVPYEAGRALTLLSFLAIAFLLYGWRKGRW